MISVRESQERKISSIRDILSHDTNRKDIYLNAVKGIKKPSAPQLLIEDPLKIIGFLNSRQRRYLNLLFMIGGTEGIIKRPLVYFAKILGCCRLTVIRDKELLKKLGLITTKKVFDGSINYPMLYRLNDMFFKRETLERLHSRFPLLQLLFLDKENDNRVTLSYERNLYIYLPPNISKKEYLLVDRETNFGTKKDNINSPKREARPPWEVYPHYYRGPDKRRTYFGNNISDVDYIKLSFAEEQRHHAEIRKNIHNAKLKARAKWRLEHPDYLNTSYGKKVARKKTYEQMDAGERCDYDEKKRIQNAPRDTRPMWQIREERDKQRLAQRIATPSLFIEFLQQNGISH